MLSIMHRVERRGHDERTRWEEEEEGEERRGNVLIMTWESFHCCPPLFKGSCPEYSVTAGVSLPSLWYEVMTSRRRVKWPHIKDEAKKHQQSHCTRARTLFFPRLQAFYQIFLGYKKIKGMPPPSDFSSYSPKKLQNSSKPWLLMQGTVKVGRLSWFSTAQAG